MKLAERDAHLRELAGLLKATAAQGRGGLALLGGPVACGKTHLLATVCEEASAAGALVLRAVSSPAEEALPYGVLGQLLERVPLPAEVVDRVGRLAGYYDTGEPAGGLRPHDGPDHFTAQTLQEISRALLDLAARQPLLISVDDVHHADDESLRALLALARRTVAAPVLLVLTADEDPHSKPAFRNELLRLPHLRRFHVGPLSRTGVADLVRDRLGSTYEGLTDEFFQASGGNPGLLRALIEDHQVAGRVRRHGYGHAVLGQLCRWGETTREIAIALAVLGTDATPAALAELTGQPGDTVDHILEAMTAGGLLDNGAFRHPVAPRAVMADLTARQRGELHRAAARALRRLGARADAVARHLVAARHADPGAVHVLREAADLAEARGDDQVAVDCLGLALEACSAEPVRTAVRLRLFQSAWRSDDRSMPRHLGSVIEGAHAGHLEPGDAVTLVRQLLWLGRLDDASQVLAGLDSGRQPTNAKTAAVEQVHQWLSWAYPALAGRRRLAARPTAAPAALSETDPWLAQSACLADALTHARAGEVADRAVQVLGDLRMSRRSPWSEEAGLLALSVLLADGQHEETRRWCEEPRLMLSPGSAPRSRALALALKAEVSLRLGELTTAAEQAREALDLLSPDAWGVAVGLPLATLLLATARLGRFDEAAQYVTWSVPETLFRSRWGLAYLYARGHYYLATDHHRAALADFLACGDLLHSWGADVPGAVPWRTGAAEAWLRLGNHSQVKRLLYEQLGRPDAGVGHSRATALYVLAVAGPVGRRVQLLSEALELFEAAGDRYEQARVLTALSLAHHELDDRRRARMVFRRARHMAALCEAEPLCRLLLAVPEELRGGTAEPEPSQEATALTESEFRVAVLAVRGYTNREIANRLFVTASTVEQHLTRVYRKLGVKGRKELPADLEWSGTAASRSSQNAA
ncbi:AAA family ATPase [Streptomyces sp. NPDC051987]|uniref:helix-turn-helix transcriptional regulator n=1 Tax=Streptomyces sp. NPDC051987 TaxID=3155808 RepID=UPI00342AC883